MNAPPQPLTISLNEEHRVSGILQKPPGACACYVLAHGAGAGMKHPFVEAIAAGLAERDVATLRYQFLYMERGSKRPDPPALAHAAVRAAVQEAARLLPHVPLFAGGKSFGGRMTSQAQATSPLPTVRGLAFLGFPLHPAGRPSDERGKHLVDVRLPMLFLSGTRDELATLELLEALCRSLGEQTTLQLIQDADHSFRRRARGREKNADVLEEVLDSLVSWIERVLAR